MKLKLLLLTFLISSNVFAGVLLEPYLGYRTGGAEATVVGQKIEFDSSGHVLGARVGYLASLISFGLQYEIGAQKTNQTAPTSEPDVKNSTNALGVFVGFHLPMLRFWGTYFLDAKSEVSETNTTTGDDKGDEQNGKGFALGAGFTGLPFIALNLEYRMITIDELKDSTGTTSLPTSQISEIDANEIILSVSAPFDL